VELNIIHPLDIARIVLLASGNPKTYGKAYNAVNPERVVAKRYFEIIGKLLGVEVKISNRPIKSIWEEQHGWVLTTLPHLYDVQDLQDDINFIPSIGLEAAIQDAFFHYPHLKEISKIPVHNRMTLMPRPKNIDWLFQRIPGQ
jgi:nucleoside-diphosphate-sugar epimerase